MNALSNAKTNKISFDHGSEVADDLIIFFTNHRLNPFDFDWLKVNQAIRPAE